MNLFPEFIVEAILKGKNRKAMIFRGTGFDSVLGFELYLMSQNKKLIVKCVSSPPPFITPN